MEHISEFELINKMLTFQEHFGEEFYLVAAGIMCKKVEASPKASFFAALPRATPEQQGKVYQLAKTHLDAQCTKIQRVVAAFK